MSSAVSDRNHKHHAECSHLSAECIYSIIVNEYQSIGMFFCFSMNAKFRIQCGVSGEIAVICDIQLLLLAISPQIAYLGFVADFLSCHIGLGLGLPHFCQLSSNGLGHIGKVGGDVD